MSGGVMQAPPFHVTGSASVRWAEPDVGSLWRCAESGAVVSVSATDANGVTLSDGRTVEHAAFRREYTAQG